MTEEQAFNVERWSAFISEEYSAWCAVAERTGISIDRVLMLASLSFLNSWRAGVQKSRADLDKVMPKLEKIVDASLADIADDSGWKE